MKKQCGICTMKKYLVLVCQDDFYKTCPHHKLLDNEDKLGDKLQILTNENYEMKNLFDKKH